MNKTGPDEKARPCPRLTMNYLSTRGHPDRKRFCEILLEGLAPDGGLYLPEHYPQVDAATLARWRTLSYADLAFEVLSLYIDDIPAPDLRAICRKTYTEAVFGTPKIVPLKELKDTDSLAAGTHLYLEALSNGPTLAFKDMAMQLLGNLFEYELARRGEELNILGATSGDTGSAAEYAMRGKRGVRVFMTSPHGRMSPFQQAQMFSLQDGNIHNLAVLGVFDDCQDIVKAVSNDLAFKRQYKIGTVNSINWARLMAQVVYYFAGYFQATNIAPTLVTSSAALPPEGAHFGSAALRESRGGPSENSPAVPGKVSFAVPSGNFGNVCAGHVARMMGLPIDTLVVATNENDVLDEFFRTGVYRVRSSVDTHETSSPSMDISKASNFERFVFDLLGRDAAKTKALFGEQLGKTGQFDLSRDPAFAQAAQRYGFVSGKSTHADRLATIRDTFARYGVMIDTHTADGVKVAREHLKANVPMIVLETALPIKFAATIVEALGREPDRPAKFAGIEALPKRVTLIDADVAVVKAYIVEKCR
jgi:threonine synthase